MKQTQTESELKFTHVYAGMYVPPSDTAFKHEQDKYYFSPKTYSSPVPFSRAHDTQDQAELAAAEWEKRFDLNKLGLAEGIAA